MGQPALHETKFGAIRKQNAPAVTQEFQCRGSVLLLTALGPRWCLETPQDNVPLHALELVPWKVARHSDVTPPIFICSPGPGFLRELARGCEGRSDYPRAKAKMGFPRAKRELGAESGGGKSLHAVDLQGPACLALWARLRPKERIGPPWLGCAGVYWHCNMKEHVVKRALED